ncbi:MAG: acyl-CoA dehydrogenase family protein [Polyangiaceae bacterium]|nr:acyl-CoA dehydrogenase family protein [Polyangiaceae bacterium]
MDMSFSPEDLAFRAEVRDFLGAAMPAHLAAKAAVDGHFEMHEIMEWHRVLFAKGWVAPGWPVEHGGPRLTTTQRFILGEELALAGAPGLSPFGLSMVGPLIMQFGTEAQKRRFLPRILSGDEVWCQGYSEPNAGSDLASLRSSAVDDGRGSFVVNGQKTWTTYGQYADWIFCLVRTDASGKKQQGISFLLVDMKTPGVTVKPMLTIGGTPAFCETFFEDVVVPKENLVGPLHGGWTVAKALLGHERTMIGGVGASLRALRRLKRIARETTRAGAPLLDDPMVAAKIARLEVRLRSLEMANYRTLAAAALGHAPGPESSILKIRGSEIQQDCFELAMEIMGHDALSWHDTAGAVPALETWVPSTYCYNRATTIYGGSNEIQKNIIAKLILGLS